MPPTTLHLVSWNINARSGLDRHLQVLTELRPDIVALQEVRPSALDELREGFSRLGLNNVHDSVRLAAEHDFDRGQMIASRWPLQTLPRIETHYQHSVLSSGIVSPWGQIELHNAHIPNGSNHGWVKIKTFEAIYRHLGRLADHPRVLCGDFNTPIAELPDGQVVTAAYDEVGDGFVSWGTWRDGEDVEDSAERWDAAERSVIAGLASFGLPDIFRLLHGYSVPAASWYTRSGVGRRFDHIFAVRTLGPIRCAYLDLFGQKLSDHAPIEAVFAPVSRAVG